MATKGKRVREDTPASRPLRRLARDAVVLQFAAALEGREGVAGAHCIHELWMRNELPMNVERMLEQLWKVAPESVQVAARFKREGRGRTNIYLVLLDYEDSTRGPYGVYVGMTQYTPAVRFDQHKAGIRSAGSVLKRGLEVLTGPVLHLQGLKRAQAAAVEEQLAEALRAEALLVQGGH